MPSSLAQNHGPPEPAQSSTTAVSAMACNLGWPMALKMFTFLWAIWEDLDVWGIAPEPKQEHLNCYVRVHDMRSINGSASQARVHWGDSIVVVGRTGWWTKEKERQMVEFEGPIMSESMSVNMVHWPLEDDKWCLKSQAHQAESHTGRNVKRLWAWCRIV